MPLLREKSGRWSPEKIVAFVGGCIPVFWLIYRAWTGDLSAARPINDAIHSTGNYAIWWSYIPHFIASPGYVYAYAYGQLLALSVYRLYVERGEEIVPAYLEMLASGGSRSPEELAAIVGVDLADPEFWDRGLDLVAEQLDAAEAAAEEVLAAG